MIRIGLVINGNQGKVSNIVVEDIPSGSQALNVSGWSVITTKDGVEILRLNTSCG